MLGRKSRLVFEWEGISVRGSQEEQIWICQIDFPRITLSLLCIVIDSILHQTVRPMKGEIVTILHGSSLAQCLAGIIRTQIVQYKECDVFS